MKCDECANFKPKDFPSPRMEWKRYSGRWSLYDGESRLYLLEKYDDGRLCAWNGHHFVDVGP